MKKHELMMIKNKKIIFFIALTGSKNKYDKSI